MKRESPAANGAPEQHGQGAADASSTNGAPRPNGKFPAGLKNEYEPRRGYVPWRPQAKVQVRLAQVMGVFADYEDHLPLTVRQVYYRLVGAYGWEKTQNTYDNLIYYLGRARRARVIPFDWLRDDGITVVQDRWYGQAADFWDHVARQARGFVRDKQDGQPVYVELWTEATGMLPQLAAVANEYSVPVYSAAGGFSGICGVRTIVDHALARNVPMVVLHVGDWDPYGEDLFRALTEDAAAFLLEDRIIGTQRITADRVALTADQVEQHELPTEELKKPKSKGHEAIHRRWQQRYGNVICQAEALPPDALADLVREGIERHLDTDLVVEHELAEERERVQLLRALPSGEPS